MRVLLFDQKGTSDSIGAGLTNLGVKVSSAGDEVSFFGLLEADTFDVVMCDLDLSRPDFRSFLEVCTQRSFMPPLIVLSDDISEDAATWSIEAGAEDCLPRSGRVKDLANALKRAVLRARRKRHKHLSFDSEEKLSSVKYIVHSESMKQVFATAHRLAAFPTTVLITGESGTGKELVAKDIHLKSPRRTKPFIAINCGALPENLVESELFGHRKGSFTDATRDKVGLFEEAEGGTIFLDEIGELSLHLQVKLLRALQEQKIRRVGDEQQISIDVRVIAATLRNLEEDVRAGRFRDDLYYRLNVVSINLPPLRERREEIPYLVKYFVKKHTKRLGLPVKGFTSEAIKLLSAYNWRGNVRELENCVERCIVLTDTEVIGEEVLPGEVREGATSGGTSSAAPFDDSNLSIKSRTKDLEINLIKRALLKTNGNRTHAAKILEISHRALLYKLKEYDLGGES